MKLFPIASLLVSASATSAFSLPPQTSIGVKCAGNGGSPARPFSSPTSLASFSNRNDPYSPGYYDGDGDGSDSYGYGGGSGRRDSRYRSSYGNGNVNYGRGAGRESGVLARRRDGAYGSGYGRYYDDEFSYGGGGYYDDLTPREFTPSERKGIRRLQQRRYGGGDYSRGRDYYDEDYFGGRRMGRREGWRDYYPSYGDGRGGRRSQRYGRARDSYDDFGYGGRYGYAGYGRGSRGGNYESYRDYDDYGDYYPESMDFDDQRYSSRRGRRNQGFRQWGNLVGGAARRSFETVRGGY